MGENPETVDVAEYAPTPIFIRGLLKAIFGGVFLAAAGFIAYLAIFEIGPGSSGDTLLLLLPVVVMLLFALHLPGGIGRMRSAFAKDCYLRAGRDGIFVRMPRQKLFGRFSVLYWHLRWDEISRIVDYTYRVNGIPMSRELHIRLQDNTVLRIASYYFSGSVGTIQSRLLGHMAAWK